MRLSGLKKPISIFEIAERIRKHPWVFLYNNPNASSLEHYLDGCMDLIEESGLGNMVDNNFRNFSAWVSGMISKEFSSNLNWSFYINQEYPEKASLQKSFDFINVFKRSKPRAKYCPSPKLDKLIQQQGRIPKGNYGQLIVISMPPSNTHWLCAFTDKGDFKLLYVGILSKLAEFKFSEWRTIGVKKSKELFNQLSRIKRAPTSRQIKAGRNSVN